MQVQYLWNERMAAIVKNKVLGFLGQDFLRELMGHPALCGRAIGTIALHGALDTQFGWRQYSNNAVQLALTARFEDDGRFLDGIRRLLCSTP